MKKSDVIEIKDNAATAFESQFGVRPPLTKITLLESAELDEDGFCYYINFLVGNIEYDFDGFTLTKICNQGD